MPPAVARVSGSCCCARARRSRKRLLETRPEQVLARAAGRARRTACTARSRSPTVVEEPAAARVHEHRVPLHLQQLQRRARARRASSARRRVRARGTGRRCRPSGRARPRCRRRAPPTDRANSAPAALLERGASASRSQSSASRSGAPPAPGSSPACRRVLQPQSLAPALDAVRAAPRRVLERSRPPTSAGASRRNSRVVGQPRAVPPASTCDSAHASAMSP